MRMLPRVRRSAARLLTPGKLSGLGAAHSLTDTTAHVAVYAPNRWKVIDELAARLH